jgi:hypothetical protein
MVAKPLGSQQDLTSIGECTQNPGDEVVSRSSAELKYIKVLHTVMILWMEEILHHLGWLKP